MGMGRHKMATILVLSAALVAVAAFSGLAPRAIPLAGAEEAAGTRIISAVGEATVSAKPDIAYVALGVNTQANTAAEAQVKNNAAMNDVLAAIKQMGIADEDVRTSQFSMYPVYGDERPVPGAAPSEPKVVGYRANNTVTITVRNLSRTGAVIDQCVKVGANQIQHVTFALKDDAKYRYQALEEAARASRGKAESMAKGLGLTITGIKSVHEVSAGPTFGYVMYDRAGAGAPQAAVSPGSIDVRAEVRVEYTY